MLEQKISAINSQIQYAEEQKVLMLVLEKALIPFVQKIKEVCDRYPNHREKILKIIGEELEEQIELKEQIKLSEQKSLVTKDEPGSCYQSRSPYWFAVMGHKLRRK